MTTHFYKKIFTAVIAITILSLAPSALIAQEDDEFFTIPECIKQALTTSPEIQKFVHNTRANQKNLDSSKGQYLPKLDADGEWGVGSTDSAARRSAGREDIVQDRGNVGLTLTQTLYNGQATGSRVEINEARLESSGKRLEDAAQALGLDCVRAYMEVVRYRTLVSLSDENVNTHRIILASLQERQQAGVGSIADVTQTQGRLARALSSMAEDKRNLTSAIATYRKVVGQEPPENMYPEEPGTLPFGTVEELIALARDKNPRLLALAADVREARKTIGLRNASLLPTVNLELSTDYTDKDGSYTEDNQAMVTANWNLFNGGSDMDTKRSATETKLQALATLAEERRVIEEEIRQTWSRYESDMEQIELFTEAVYYNRQTSDSYLQQFNIGQRSLLDVLDAENETFQSSSLLVTTQADHVVAYYRLLTLAGKLLSEVNINPELYVNNKYVEEN
ncbi:MAG: TolC family outer membrane protein [Desulfovibrio sp.]